jgi:hypothetical protein
MTTTSRSDPADPVPLPTPPQHLASQWAQGVATPQYLRPLVILVLLLTSSAALAFVWRARTLSVTVVPAESAISDVAVRALPANDVLKDFMSFLVTSSESWTPDTVRGISGQLVDFVHPTFRQEFARRQRRLLDEVGSLSRQQAAIILDTRIVERKEGTALLDTAVEIHTLVFAGQEPKLSHSEIRIFTAEVTADVATDRNRQGLLLKGWRIQTETQWKHDKLPLFWEEEFNRRRDEHVKNVMSGNKDATP